MCVCDCTPKSINSLNIYFTKSNESRQSIPQNLYLKVLFFYQLWKSIMRTYLFFGYNSTKSHEFSIMGKIYTPKVSAKPFLFKLKKKISNTLASSLLVIRYSNYIPAKGLFIEFILLSFDLSSVGLKRM